MGRLVKKKTETQAPQPFTTMLPTAAEEQEKAASQKKHGRLVKKDTAVQAPQPFTTQPLDAVTLPKAEETEGQKSGAGIKGIAEIPLPTAAHTYAAQELNPPTFGERLGKTVLGGAKGSLASNTNALATLYAAAEGGRSKMRENYLSDYAQSLGRAEGDLAAMLETNERKPGTFTAGDIASQRSVVEDARKKHEAMLAAEAAEQGTVAESQALADSVQESSAKDIERAKQGAGGVGQVLVDAGASMTQTLLDGLASNALGGGMSAFALRAFGGAAQQARQDGADLRGQLTYGALSAAKEVLTEKMFNIALPKSKIYGGGTLDDAVARGIRSAVDRFAKTDAGKRALGGALTFGASAVSEGLEELIGDWMEWQLPRVYGGDVATAQETLANSLYDFLVGATSGALGGAVDRKTYHYDVKGGTTAQTDAQPTQESAQAAEDAETQTAPQTQEGANAGAKMRPEDIKEARRQLREAYEAGKLTEEELNASEQGLKELAPEAYTASLREDAEASAETAAQAQRLSAMIGREIVFYEMSADGNGIENGYFDTTDGKIHVNVKSENPLAQVVAHELTHSIELAESYGELSDLVLRRIGESADLVQLRAQKAELYAKNGVKLKSETEIDRELVAEYVEKNLLTDEKSIRKLTEENYSLGRVILDWLDRLLAKLGSASARERAFLTRARDAYADALGETRTKEAQTKARSENAATREELHRRYAAGEITEEDFDAQVEQIMERESMAGQSMLEQQRHSISETEDGKRYVRAERQVIFGNDPQSWSEQLEDYINGKIRRGQDVYLTAADGDILTLTATSAGKLSDNHTSDGRTMSETAYERKANAAAHIDELAEVSTRGNKNVPDYNKRHGSMASGGWNYRTAYFEDFDGKYYEVTISVAESADGKIIYNIGKMKEEASPKVNGSRDVSANGLRGFASSRGSITENGKNVKRQYSVSEEQDKRIDLKTYAETQREKSLRAALPKKAQTYLKGVERNLTTQISNALGTPKFAQRGFLQDVAAQISEEYLREGSVSEETTARLFEEAYAQSVAVDDGFFKAYKPIKEKLRTMRVTIAEGDKADIADWNNFRKSTFGTLRIVNKGGTAVDVAYEQLRDAAPELFPENITHPADRLIRMFEVAQSIARAEKSLDEYYGEEAPEFKKWAKREFDEAVWASMREMRKVKRYADERAGKGAKRAVLPTAQENAQAAQESTQEAEAPEPLRTVEEVKKAYEQLKTARKRYEKVAAKNLLTEEDEKKVGRLLRGELELTALDPSKDNVSGITAVYEAKIEYERLSGQLREWNAARRAELRAQADTHLQTANSWKDKKMGILYSRETMRRNVRDIVPDEAVASSVIDTYFTPVQEGAAQANKLKNAMRDRVRALKLSTKETKAMQEKGQVSEAHAVQLIGEAMDNITMIENARGRMQTRDGKTLGEWKAVVSDLWANNPQLDRDKIEGAIKEFRSIYDELFEQMNNARIRNGYEPVNYRKGYFPHFQPGGDGIVGLFGKALDIKTEVTALPTTINGLTHTFRPGIRWFANAQQRRGFNTAYDAVEGFDRYIEGVADVICQTDNIQRLRAFSQQARYRTSDEGIRMQVDAVNANTELSEQDKQNRIDKIYKDGRYTLSNFVVELEEYTNLLANKRSRADRTMEQMLGRRAFNIAKALESRVAANMVAINPASWLTNYIPLTQGGAQLGRAELLRGMWQTLQAMREDDGIAAASTFLTNRRGSDPLVRSWVQETSAKLSSPMEHIDQFTAGSLVRARYNQNLAQGLSAEAAMREADSWVADVMADRSKGSMPTIFSQTNPLTKVFTQFQLEVNNQLSYLFKDLPREQKKKGMAALCLALWRFFLGAWLYDEVYEFFIGRRPALDPLGILNDTVGDLTGYELPNMVELGIGAATGNMPSFKTEKEDLYGAGVNLVENVMEQVPFASAVGAIIGIESGGRYPVSNAYPDWDSLGKALGKNDWSAKKRVSTGLRALSGTAAYTLPSFGGGQVKKVYQGLKAVIEGGSYTVDAKGNDILQYPVYTDDAWQTAENTARAVLFGKTATKTGQEWVESGFRNASAKETAAYQGMTAVGVSQKEAFALIKELRDADKTETESEAAAKRRILREAKISGDGKSVVYYGMLASDKERELMDALADADAEADMGEVTSVLLDVKDADGNRAKRMALAESALGDDEKAIAYNYLFGEQQEDGTYANSRCESFVSAGLDTTTAYRIASALDASEPVEGKTSVSNVQKYRAVVDVDGLTQKQQMSALNVLMTESEYAKLEAGFEHGITPEAYVTFKETLVQFDADENGTFSQAEVQAALDSMGGGGITLPGGNGKKKLTTAQQAVLWQLANKSWKAKNNPYSVSVGREVYNMLNGAEEGGRITLPR